MQLEPRRAIITLVWAGCIIAAGPAIGYAQGASEHARLGPTVTGSEYSGVEFAAQPPSIAVRQDDNVADNVAEYANNHLWMLEDQLRAARDLAELLSVDVD